MLFCVLFTLCLAVGTSAVDKFPPVPQAQCPSGCYTSVGLTAWTCPDCNIRVNGNNCVCGDGSPCIPCTPPEETSPEQCPSPYLTCTDFSLNPGGKWSVGFMIPNATFAGVSFKLSQQGTEWNDIYYGVGCGIDQIHYQFLKTAKAYPAYAPGFISVSSGYSNMFYFQIVCKGAFWQSCNGNMCMEINQVGIPRGDDSCDTCNGGQQPAFSTAGPITNSCANRTIQCHWSLLCFAFQVFYLFSKVFFIKYSVISFHIYCGLEELYRK